ncbi:hypothetical protein CEXT_261341 [Caerostris extrusa]|uniref:Uncharacterized protein n=1 Tax=Caerostris extrusa TaxID=172846 RepID=A0AAV4U0E3_CAEEX|nr:hypothetical protein CEXT_261341 [Caerostris extrusa]
MHFAGRVVFEKEQVRCLKIVRRDSGVLPACLRSRKNEEVRKQSSFHRLRPKSCLSTVTQDEEKNALPCLQVMVLKGNGYLFKAAYFSLIY